MLESTFSTPNVVSTHSRLKAAGFAFGQPVKTIYVSTHSRLKAAGHPIGNKGGHIQGFNTQPPEGGWLSKFAFLILSGRFQHTAA